MHFEAFRPVCPRCGDGAFLEIARVLREHDGDIVAGILHCPRPACRQEYPIVDSIPLMAADLHRLLGDRGVEMMLRDDLEPDLESLLGDAIGPDSWYDAIRQITSTYAWDSYAALDPAEIQGGDAAPLPGAAARCLDRLLDLTNGAAPVTRALDLGCAAGGTSFALAARHPDALVVGADLNLGLLRLARRAAAGTVSYSRRRIGLVYDRRLFSVALPGAGRVDFWACDATALPLRDATADLVAALNLLDCVAEPSLLLAELRRVLAPQGHLLLATPFDWSTRATQPAHWIGGHSQRAVHAGAGEMFLRELLTGGAHPQSVTGLTLCGEVANWPWHTRLHDRAAMRYETHLLTLQRADDD
jgi:SAM-dependent methyltransferase/uncharacterized protein YbaR (Trm112 family)